MDIHQIENIIAIERERSILKASQKLFLTQSALNQQLLRLEKELDTRLFERRKTGMTPTFAGRIYLATARQMVDMKKETYKIIHDISEENTGEISLAYTPERGPLMFPYVYPVFHQRYPNITLRIQEARVEKMEQLLLEKEVILVGLTYSGNFKNPDLEYLDMAGELMVLGLSKSHPLAYLAGERSWETFPQLDLKLLKNEYFTLIFKETRMRDVINLAFGQAGFRLKILFESTSTPTVVNMVKNQACPVFFPQSYVEANASIVYFSAPPKQSWIRRMAYLKGTYLTRPEKAFLRLCTLYTQGKPLVQEGEEQA